MNPKIAIVIPAYKAIFFRKTIQSIADQTDKNFTLYIGNDASSDDLYKIIKEYENEISITYKRFEKNIGNIDLVAHWNRCIDMVQDEEWIWLFSDDDIMETDCVAKLNDTISKKPDVDLFHFNIMIIDQFDNIIKIGNTFPEMLAVMDFFSKKIKYNINSSVVEYIFRKSIYVKENGFENYDLGWCSDDATWIKFGKCKGILTLPESKVKWRYSGSNISSIVKDKKIVLRKLQSAINHIKWVTDYFSQNNLIDNTTNFDKFKWIISTVLLSPALSTKENFLIGLKISREMGFNDIKIASNSYIAYWTVKKKYHSVIMYCNYKINKLKL